MSFRPAAHRPVNFSVRFTLHQDKLRAVAFRQRVEFLVPNLFKMRQFFNLI